MRNTLIILLKGTAIVYSEVKLSLPHRHGIDLACYANSVLGELYFISEKGR